MLRVLTPGIQTTVQDFPGRTWYWNIGIPPSGPMDSLSLRIANRLVGNPEGAAGLEITLIGPSLEFEKATTIAISGAKLQSRLEGKEIPWNTPIAVKAGQVLEMGNPLSVGCRTYLAISGGIDTPDYLGSQSTFVSGKFGGFEGSALLKGDRLKFRNTAKAKKKTEIPANLIPEFKNHWEIGTVPGPHSAPDYFLPDDVNMFFSTNWKVHYNSNRLGYRLDGPAPQFARENGGEGGHHPSNLHDYVYSIGTINFTGNLPVILTQDGPSLGGFVCMATIAKAELWKVGQAKPNDTIRFIRLTYNQALDKRREQERLICSI